MKSKKLGIDLAGKQNLSCIWLVRGPRMRHRCSVVMSMGQPRVWGNGRHTMNSRETCLLRTKLRQVNMEYSALVRDRAQERRFVRLGELRTERRALMNLLLGGANSKRCPTFRPDVEAAASGRPTTRPFVGGPTSRRGQHVGDPFGGP
jgi:hypothetical protein